jgi:hypothetical protein
VLVDPNDDAMVVKLMIADVRGAAITIGREIEVFYAGNVDDIDTGLAAPPLCQVNPNNRTNWRCPPKRSSHRSR